MPLPEAAAAAAAGEAPGAGPPAPPMGDDAAAAAAADAGDAGTHSVGPSEVCIDDAAPWRMKSCSGAAAAPAAAASAAAAAACAANTLCGPTTPGRAGTPPACGAAPALGGRQPVSGATRPSPTRRVNTARSAHSGGSRPSAMPRKRSSSSGPCAKVQRTPCGQCAPLDLDQCRHMRVLMSLFSSGLVEGAVPVGSSRISSLPCANRQRSPYGQPCGWLQGRGPGAAWGEGQWKVEPTTRSKAPRCWRARTDSQGQEFEDQATEDWPVRGEESIYRYCSRHSTTGTPRPSPVGNCGAEVLHSQKEDTNLTLLHRRRERGGATQQTFASAANDEQCHGQHSRSGFQHHLNRSLTNFCTVFIASSEPVGPRRRADILSENSEGRDKGGSEMRHFTTTLATAAKSLDYWLQQYTKPGAFERKQPRVGDEETFAG